MKAERASSTPSGASAVAALPSRHIRRTRSTSAPAVIALDLESVLVPEIWETVARKTGVEQLARTTREEPDYDLLMRQRIGLCRQHGLTLVRLRAIVGAMAPLPGAVRFLAWARSRALTVVASDTFHELAGPLMARLGQPPMICNRLETDPAGYIARYRFCHPQRKRQTVRSFKKLGFRVAAVGDSYNDLAMLAEAEVGLMFRPGAALSQHRNEFRTVCDFDELKHALASWLGQAGGLRR